MNKISMTMKLYYVIKTIQFFFFTPVKKQLPKAEEIKNNEVKIYSLILAENIYSLIAAAKIVKLLFMMIITMPLTPTITSALINSSLINNL